MLNGVVSKIDCDTTFSRLAEVDNKWAHRRTELFIYDIKCKQALFWSLSRLLLPLSLSISFSLSLSVYLSPRLFLARISLPVNGRVCADVILVVFFLSPRRFRSNQIQSRLPSFEFPTLKSSAAEKASRTTKRKCI